MFERLVAIYRDITFDEGSRSGTLMLRDDAQRRELIALLDEDIVKDTGLVLDRGDPATCAIGQQLRFTVQDPKMAWGLLAQDVEELLKRSQERLKEPARYYVVDQAFCSTDARLVPDKISVYRQVLQLVNILKDSADYLDPYTGTLIFLGEDKFDVPVNYDASDLSQVDKTAIEKLIRDFADPNDAHREQKWSLLAKSVRSVAGSAVPKKRFSTLLGHLPDLQKHVADGYRLFVADFSYDKVINQIEAAKVEEIGKIHKAFSDIQNQILGIPVATVIVATQMKLAEKVGYEFWVNTAVLVGCYVFVLLSALMLRNQLHTLDTLKIEIERKQNQMLDQYSEVADLVTGSFPALFGRLRTQRFAFYFVGVILLVGLVLSHVLYFALTQPAADKLHALLARFGC